MLADRFRKLQMISSKGSCLYESLEILLNQTNDLKENANIIDRTNTTQTDLIKNKTEDLVRALWTLETACENLRKNKQSVTKVCETF